MRPSVALVLLAVNLPAIARGGDVRGTVRFRGAGPASPSVETTKDRAVCGEAVPDERVVCASGFVPGDTRGIHALRAAAARLREAVSDAIPFFERHLVAESAPLVADPSRAELPPVHPLYAADLDSTLGVTGVPVRGPWKNLFFAGREVLPGLGMEGELYAGIQAAGYVAAIVMPARRPR